MGSQKALITDVASASITYIGEAAIGMAQSSPFWRIRKLTTTGNIVVTTWADVDEEYDNVWNDRATLTYG